MSVQIIFILAIFAVFIVSSMAANMVERAATLLDRETLDRIWKRQVRTTLYWRIPDVLGIGMLIAGVLKMLGILRIFTDTAWGIPTMTLGLAVISVACCLRAWLTQHAYVNEAPDTPASQKALQSAVIVTVAEVLLAGGVCWYVFTHLPSSSSTPRQATQRPAPGVTTPEDSAPRKLWVDQDEALKMLPGKSAAYLDALVRRQDVRGKKENGRTLYRADDIKQTKVAGLPTDEEVKDDMQPKR
jgi:hypothetical protein